MPSKSSEKKPNTRSKIKRRKEDSDSSDDDNEIEYILYSNDEDDEDSDSDSDSDYIPKSQKKKKVYRVLEYESDESPDEETDDEEIEYDIEDDEDGSNIDPRELRKTIATLFPSNYINEKVKQDDKQYKKSKKNIKTVKSKKVVKEKKKHKKRVEESDTESDDEFYEEDEDDDDDDDADVNDFNMLFSALTGGGPNEDEINDQNAIKDDRHEECDSDDEKLFMRENYETIPIPEGIVTKSMKNKQKDKEKKKQKKRNTSEKSDNSETVDAEKEYKSLIELKKYLSTQLKENPKSKILMKAVDECHDSIRKLVKKSRLKNAKKYYKMVNGQDEKKTGEIEYFKKQ